MSASGVAAYFARLGDSLNAAATQRDAIATAGALIAETVRSGGVVHTFGTGHSHLLAEEPFYRAGGLAPVNPIQDDRITLSRSALASTAAERQAGLAAEILARYDVRDGDAAIVISNSGRNAAPVEAACWFSERGIPVIALTSLTHSRSVEPRNRAGKRLCDVVDVVLDNCGVPGDAAVAVAGLAQPMGPTSTAVGSALLHAVFIAAAEQLAAAGVPPVVFPSANADAAQTADLEAAVRAVASRIPCL